MCFNEYISFAILLVGKRNYMTRSEQAKKYFEEGYNCTQAVVLAFKDKIEIDQNLLLKTVSSFGGGMSRLREVCGAVSGMFFVAGALYGYNDIHDKNKKIEHYARIQDLAKKFRDKNGSIVCRDLLGLKSKQSDKPIPEDRTPDYYRKRPCAILVECAASIIEDYVNSIENKNRVSSN